MRSSGSGWRLAVGCWLAGVLAHAATVDIALRPQVTLAAKHATLGDLAELNGPADAVASLAGIIVQELTSGELLIDERLVRSRLGRLPAGMSMSVRGQTQVRRAVRTIPVERLAQVAAAAIIDVGDDAEFAVVRGSGPMRLPDDGVEPHLEATPLDRAAVGDVPLRVSARQGEIEVSRALVVLRVRRFAHIAILVADHPRGRAIGVGDVLLQRSELTTATQAAFRSLEEVIGRESVRDLSAGQAVTPNLTVKPYDIKPGQPVAIVFRTGAVELSGPGEALAAGHAGDVVLVRRLADDRRVRARVIGPGRVLVNF